jgi:hypothetical protein
MGGVAFFISEVVYQAMNNNYKIPNAMHKMTQAATESIYVKELKSFPIDELEK